jgi:hypothetical protein
VKTGLTREQARKTETRIRQLLSPPHAEEVRVEDIEKDTVDIRGQRREGQGETRQVEARKSGLCALGLCVWLCCLVCVLSFVLSYCWCLCPKSPLSLDNESKPCSKAGRIIVRYKPPPHPKQNLKR